MNIYANKAKNRWRNRMWKNISERLKARGIHPKDAVGIYFPSYEDLDRRIAVKRYGFRPYNLIGVDKDKYVCKAMKKRGNLCLHGDLIDAIDSWRPRLDFIFADYCCGLEIGPRVLMASLLDKKWANENTSLVVACNMQRGRDQSSNKIRESIQNYWSGLMTKHRGAQLLYMLTVIMDAALADNGVQKTTETMIGELDPKFDSYTQPAHKPTMDSVVFDWHQPNCSIYEHGEFGTLTNNIRALMAVRTMKINGTLRQAAVA